jgi:2-dehydro-3-deoxyglucarate aldolase
MDMPEDKRVEISIGSWLSLGSAHVAEIMVRAGFEWLVIDMEHSAANTMSSVDRLIQVIDLAGCRALARVPENDPTVIKQVMDAGAHGVVIPMVNNAAEARAAVQAVRYPPLGSRGVGLWRAQGYGRSFDDYQSWLEQESWVIVQIEHIRAVENLAEILAVDGVDGFIIGPYDLSASLGVPGDFDRPSMIAALTQVETVAKSTEKWAGYHVVHPDLDLFRDVLRRGYNLIAFGVDFTFLTHAIDGAMTDITSFRPGGGR